MTTLSLSLPSLLFPKVGLPRLLRPSGDRKSLFSFFLSIKCPCFPNSAFFSTSTSSSEKCPILPLFLINSIFSTFSFVFSFSFSIVFSLSFKFLLSVESPPKILLFSSLVTLKDLLSSTASLSLSTATCISSTTVGSISSLSSSSFSDDMLSVSSLANESSRTLSETQNK